MKKSIGILLSLLLIMSITLQAAAFKSVPLKSIKLDLTQVTLKDGQTYKLKITLLPANTTQKLLTYSTANKKIATIDRSGSITAVGVGKTVVTVSSSINKQILAKCNVIVKAKNKVKITVGLCSSGTKIPGAETNFMRAEILKAINVDVEMQPVDSFDDYKNQINVKLAAGTAPDVFQLPDRATMVTLANNGVLLDLTPYNSRLQPFLDFTGKDNAKKSYVNGKSYGLFKAPPVNYYALWIKKDWLDALKLKTPTTIDELFEVAKAFTEKDPDGNGKKDTYGITASKSMFPFNWLMLPYGISGGMELIVKDGKLTSNFETPEFKEGLKDVQKFIEAGVIDPDSFTNNDSQTFQKIAQGKAGIVNISWSNIAKDDQVKQIKAVDPKAEWMPIDPLKGPGGQYIANSDVGGGSSYALPKTIKKSSDKLQAVIDLFNFAASSGNKLTLYGVKDKHWTEKNGKITMTELGKTEATYTWLYQFAGRKEVDYLKTKFAGQAKYIDQAGKKWPILKTYDGVVTKLADYNKADAEKYFSEEVTKVIFGKAPVSEWDNAVNTLMTTYKYKAYKTDAEKQLKANGYIK